MQHHMPDQRIAMSVAMRFRASHHTDCHVRYANVKSINDAQQRLFQTVSGPHWLPLEKILLRMMMVYVHLLYILRMNLHFNIHIPNLCRILLCLISGWKEIYQFHRRVSFVKRHAGRCYGYKIGDAYGVCN